MLANRSNQKTDYIVVMKNVFYNRKLSHIFDLKGSLRGRRISQNEIEKRMRERVLKMKQLKQYIQPKVLLDGTCI